MPVLSAFVIVLALAAVVMVTVVAAAAGRALPAPPPEEPRRRDPVLDELRRRYAIGEIDREEFLQRKIDLEE
ncbi:SHOCT domain-containing protein [Nocardiopsis composta]|uniref:Putative membrane protein n=1 Tax=Nocardiopsis composta TaxID=157465 RepID=A0A7W8VCC6_9ACTN|nr:SHOCT domain-containing protein [Nocardiopsis composta]MBB5430825.1 putative membrane protein [Nocardiopsis composta]